MGDSLASILPAAAGRFVHVLWSGILLVYASTASAHEMGAMKVAAFFSSDGRYEIDVTLDPEHLPAGLGPVAADRTILIERIRRDMRIRFDGEDVQPEDLPPRYAQPNAAGAGGAPPYCRFGGKVPAGAHSYTWSYNAISGQYLLGSRNEGDSGMSWQWIKGPATSQPFALQHAPPPLTRGQVVRAYLRLGFTHILPGGLDHILFVLGLFLMSLKRRVILTQITAFTVAHSITLGLTIYGVVSLSSRIVEPLIAVSIVYVGIENLLSREAGPRRLAVVFCFGLLHGMGFAGVLRELGLPRSEFLTALASFNVGVELGQLTVVSAAFLAFGFWFRSKPWYRTYLTNPASASIALVGLYWAVQRVLF